MTILAKVPAYPGHGATPSPRGGPRVKAEGEPNYIKGQGTVKERVFDDTAPLVRTPKPSPRCPTSCSRENYKLGWYGNVSPLLKGAATPRPETAPYRVKPEAEATAFISRGPRMRCIINEYARRGASPREPRVKPEAAETAEVSKGGRMHNLLHKYGSLPLSARAVPRLKLEAEPIAELSRGEQMKQTLHNYGLNTPARAPEPRVKPEGEDNAELNKGKRMGNILHKYGHAPLSARAVPRVKPEGSGNAFLDSGIRMGRLMHEPRGMPCSPRPAPRTNTTQAKQNALKGRGSMDLVFDNIARKTFVYLPGQQAKQYVRASIG
ncbi:uncharacterized protein LOC131942494 [Physella acuta]|uniref:uncharacterized protein LOC131942494 n=1 Tax=Physella acuta TaxID=109671 RepID=UPI0027DB5161|nr:uncharacterized protein LOC131942494 [Physella acuta]XP_059158389.1 uncharacterized protein LOC131942494 [Physella acuta]XP_059158397.1 uncharacterized protein LOC131942494 [Physella acuta]